MAGSAFIGRVKLRNYRSIASCDVPLDGLRVLVGRNGAGTSNFVDALCFVSEALRGSLDQALLVRGGIQEVRRRTTGHFTHVGLSLDFELGDGTVGQYSFTIGAKPPREWDVPLERCTLGGSREFVVRSGVVETTLSPAPPLPHDGLYLPELAGTAEFGPVLEALSRIGLVAPRPDLMREPQPPGKGDELEPDARNVAAVLGRLASRQPQVRRLIEQRLGGITTPLAAIETRIVGARESFDVREAAGDGDASLRFSAAALSDGTLRTLGILVGLFAASQAPDRRRTLVAVEEPALSLHPHAARGLLAALREATAWSQVVATSHSTVELDDETIADDEILAVRSPRGETTVEPVDADGRRALRDHLEGAGEPPREPPPKSEPRVRRSSAAQPSLFDLPAE